MPLPVCVGCLNASVACPLTVAVPSLTKPVTSLSKPLARFDGSHSCAKLASSDLEVTSMYLPFTALNTDDGRLRVLKKLASSFMYTVLLTSMRSAVPDTAVPLEESAALVSIPPVPLQP